MSERPRLPAALLAVLGVIAAVGPFATDTYLASFTDISRDLGVDASLVQLTLTAFLFGMGFGQLFLGPLSDRWGRRPVLLIALSVFAASSIALVFAPGIEFFVALRLVQGLSGAAGVVLSRAVAADLSDGPTAVRALSLIATVVALGPLVAPPVGGLVGSVWGWRGVLTVVAAISLAMLLLAVLRVPESLPAERRHTGGVSASVRTLGRLLRDPTTAAYVAVFALAFASMMAYIAASPFVGQTVLGMSPLAYSFSFAAAAAALVLANLVNARIAPRVGPRRMLAVGLGMALAAGVALSVTTLTGTLTPAGLIIAAFVLTGGTGLTMSNTSALAIARADTARGSGAALLGSAQFLLGGIASPVVGLWGEHTALPMALVVLGAAMGACALGVLALRRR